MINLRNLKPVLRLMGFSQNGNAFEKAFSVFHCSLKVDFNQNKLVYPNAIKAQPFYPADHCGVLRVLTDKMNPRYMTHVLESEDWKINFSRSCRASMDRIEGITITVPGIGL